MMCVIESDYTDEGGRADPRGTGRQRPAIFKLGLTDPRVCNATSQRGLKVALQLLPPPPPKAPSVHLERF